MHYKDVSMHLHCYFACTLCGAMVTLPHQSSDLEFEFWTPDIPLSCNNSGQVFHICACVTKQCNLAYTCKGDNVVLVGSNHRLGRK